MRIGDYSIVGRSLDTVRLTHPMSKPDMEHIRNLELTDFELYDLAEDIGQKNKLDISPEELDRHAVHLLTRLRMIQELGTYWENLPEAKGRYLRKEHRLAKRGRSMQQCSHRTSTFWRHWGQRSVMPSMGTSAKIGTTTTARTWSVRFRSTSKRPPTSTCFLLCRKSTSLLLIQRN